MPASVGSATIVVTPMVGTQVGNYLIEEKLGEGGMGTVYRALEVQLERRVAIKVLNSDLARNQSIVERFRAEARAQANLMHPNIAVLYAFIVQDGNAMMVMEYIDGQNIQDIVHRSGPMQVQYAVPWFQQALAGIGAAHHLGIVHRDIKPSNLMVTRAGLVKVLDFGIAKVAGGGRSLTSAGTKLGTVFYMSPEQVQAGAVDSRSDIYSLGVTLYEMLTGRVPFDSDSDFTVQKDHIQSPPPLPTTFVPGIPRGIEKIVLKAMEKRPEDRFQTVEEFSAALSNPGAWESYVPVFARGAAPMPGPQRQRTVMEAPSPYQGQGAGYQPMPPAPHPGYQQGAAPGPMYIPPPGADTGAKKPIWADKRVLIGAGVLVLIIGYFIFRPSDNKPGPTPFPVQQGQNPTPQPPNPTNQLQQLNGNWGGTCSCSGKILRMTLAINAQSFQSVNAVMSGTDPLTGVFNPGGNQLNLQFTQDRRYSIQGAVDFGSNTMRGNLFYPTCAGAAPFTLRK